ncbi:hypothetical protein Pfo_025744 [Paulownia fortunei]|nr:hypothetical protein Pfo_025744 [Paulownia fortunei]
MRKPLTKPGKSWLCLIDDLTTLCAGYLIICWFHSAVICTCDLLECNTVFYVVKKFGDDSQISLIVAEVGETVEAAPTEVQIELFDALIDGCREAVKVESLDLKLLAKWISRYEDPIFQFRALAYFKTSMCSKDCGWKQSWLHNFFLLVPQGDDARLLLGIHYMDFAIGKRLGYEKLGLTK